MTATSSVPVSRSARATTPAQTSATTNAWITLLPADHPLRAPSASGPLAGISVAVKDNIDVAGVPTTAAFPGREGSVVTVSATVVERLRAAGAGIAGKANMDQFATGLVGTRSPYGSCSSVASSVHISGGSSSGSAVLVASGTVPLALGTDTAGSGRVPAAFNGIVGLKPTRGLLSTTGVVPACAGLDCVTTFTRTVAEARTAFRVLAAPDPADPWSRSTPATLPVGVARQLRVIAVPSTPLDLDPRYAAAWDAAIAHAHTVAAHVVEVDVTAFLEAARLLYEPSFVAMRWAAFGAELVTGAAGVDDTVRAVVLPGRDAGAADLVAAQENVARLRRLAERIWPDVDALLLPTAPNHPTHDEVAADPIGVNGRLGTYTNFVNLLDLCAVAVPAGGRDDGLPFGVQLIAPAFADEPLLDLAEAWTGPAPGQADLRPGRSLVAVAGAHMSGLPLNGQLQRLGGELHSRARTAGGYRLYRLPGTGVARPGLVRTGEGRTGEGRADGIALELWDVPHQGIGALTDLIPSPLGLGSVMLADGRSVLGFLAEAAGTDGATDITAYGGWRAYLDASS
ncbi:MAG: Allophanate hydrolase [Frankiales bacterium]|nr:Allophanate hydrolase [Frankiales bacterium]